MSFYFTRISAAGHINSDPKYRVSPRGVGVCCFGMTAVNKSWSSGVSEFVWLNCVIFDRTSKNAARLLRKGRKLFIEGRLRNKEWQDKTGVKRVVLQVVVERWFIFSDKYQTLTEDVEGNK